MIGIQTENEFDRIIRDAEFSYQLMEQNREMERFVNESIILASGNRSAINEMVILNESAFTDKIKSFFEKIKNFFKKLFDKFIGGCRALFSEQDKYMEKYSTIIMKCKWNAGDWDADHDWFTGLPRILDALNNADTAIIGSNADKYFSKDIVGNDENNNGSFINVNTFKDAKSIEAAYQANPPKKEDNSGTIKPRAYQEFIATGYWSNKSGDGFKTENDENNNPNIDTTFANYFYGSENSVSYDADKMNTNFQTVINTVYSGQSIIDKLEKLNNTINDKMTKASEEMTKYCTDQENKIKTALEGKGPAADSEGAKTSIDAKIIEAAIKGKTYANSKVTININGKSYEISGGTDGNQVTYEEAKNALESQNVKVTGTPTPKENNNTGDKKTAKELEDAVKSISAFTNYDDSNKTGKITVFGKTVDLTGLKDNSPMNNLDVIKSALESQGIKFESFNIYKDYKSFFLEDGLSNKGSSSQSNDKSASQMRNSGAGTDNKNTISDANKKAGDMQTVNRQSVNVSNVSGVNTNSPEYKHATDLLSADIWNRQNRVQADTQISITIMNKIFDAFKKINESFYSMIKEHVNWYLSNPGAQDESDNKVSRTMNKDIGASTNQLNNPGNPTT